MSTSQAKILEYCIKNCIFDSWNTKLLEDACQNAGLEPNHWKIYFPNGAVDIVDYFIDQSNERMSQNVDTQGLGTTAKVKAAIIWRLKDNEPYREAIKSCLKIYALNPLKGMNATYRTVDTIWRLAGDTSTDWNFYSKRILLAGVYSTTLAFWLNDKSEGYEATYQFLDKRLGEVAKFGKGVSQLKKNFAI